MIIDTLVTLLIAPWGAMVIMFPMLLAAPGFKNSKESLLQTLAIFFYPTLIFLGYVVFDKSYFGIAPLSIFLASLMLCLIPSLVFDLHILTSNALRGISNIGYVTRAECIYLNGKRIKQAVPESFEILSEEFPSYARDGHHIYCNGIPIQHADIESFVVLQKGFAKDKLRVYSYQHPEGSIVVEGADPATFKAADAHHNT